MNGKIIKFILLAIFISFGLAQASAQTCVPAPIGLISSYAADANALDARSRNNGTIQGNITYAAGNLGQSFQLGGGNGDRILIGNPLDLRRQDFTIEAWVKRSSSGVVTNSANPGSPAGIFFAYGQGGYAFLIDQNTNKLGLSQVGFSQVLAPTLTITDTNWHHVAVTQSGPAFTAGTQTIFYLDGVADAPAGYAPQFTFTTNAAIGSRGDAQTDNVFFGAIDELSIYDRALSAAQIQAIFASGTAGKCTPLATTAPDNQILWLAGDGDSFDLSGSGSNGTLQNGAGYRVGKVGQTFNLDGTDDYVLIPQSSTHDVGASNGFTVESWINPADGQKNPIVEWSGGGSYGVHFWAGLACTGFPCSTPPQTAGALYANLIDTSNTNHQFGTPVSVASLNTWTHVALTYDKTTGIGVLYVNGAAVETRNLGVFTPKTNLPLNIGARPIPDPGGGCIAGGDCFYNGKLDEVSIYNRALSAAEIQSVSNAGLAGKYKVQATVPANIAAWYTGDGSTNDLQASNNGTLQGGAIYAGGKVGQAFSLNGTTAYVTAPSTAANDPTGAPNGASMEAWIYLNQLPSVAGRQFYIMSKNGTSGIGGFDIHIDPDNFFKFVWQGSYTGFSNFQVQTGVWYHVVATFSQTAGVRFYANGVLLGIGNVFTARTPSGAPLTIGRDTQTVSNTLFNGLIDEPAIYNSALSEAEIRDQYYAGSLGKYKTATNPTVSNKTSMGDAEVTFATLTASGAVQAMPLNASLLPALPVTNTGLVYDVSTTVGGSNPTVCFKLPSFTIGQFTGLRIYHLESGAWVNRTAGVNSYPNLCSSGLTSLSPFAIGFVPSTAANASVSGRVTFQKSGLSNATVMISGGSLAQPILTTTGSFGYYKFDNLPVGETYFLTVFSKRYVFSQPTQIINLFEDVTNGDFAGEIP